MLAYSKFRSIGFSALFLLTSTDLAFGAESDIKSFRLAAGSVDAEAFAAGVVLDSLTKLKLLSERGINLDVISTNGFRENLDLLESGEVEFAIIDTERSGLAQWQGGAIADNAQPGSLRSIATLWLDVEYLLISTDDVRTGTIDDLALIKNPAIGVIGQTTNPLEDTPSLLTKLGGELNAKFDLAVMDYDQAADSFAKRKVNGLHLSARMSNKKISEVLAEVERPIQMLQINNVQLSKLNGKSAAWVPYIIPGNTYPGQPNPVSTAARSTFLAVRADVADDVVYEITRTIFENLIFLNKMDDAWRDVSLSNALAGLPMPPHEGALRYFEEMDVPRPATAEATKFNATPSLVDFSLDAFEVPSPTNTKRAAAEAVDQLEERIFSLYYAVGKASLDDDASRTLAEAIAHAYRRDYISIDVTGHTDRTGNPAGNAKLSRLRASTVADVLEQRGIDRGKLRVNHHGEDQMAVATPDSTFEALNRRVELLVTTTADSERQNLVQVQGRGGSPMIKPPAGHPLGQLMSGYYFRDKETQTLQDDDFGNPAFLWIDQAKEIWDEVDGEAGKACTSCHDDISSLEEVGTRYPLYFAPWGKLMNLEQRINYCRTENMKATPWAYESDELLGMTSLVKLQSRGMAVDVAINGESAAFFEKGKEFYYKRRGQLNMACGSCHEAFSGMRMRADLLSQGQSNGFPAYRLKWQGLGSLHRRFKRCNSQVRAEPYAPGSDEYVNLELYLAWRGEGLPVETPSVRP